MFYLLCFIFSLPFVQRQRKTRTVSKVKKTVRIRTEICNVTALVINYSKAAAVIKCDPKSGVPSLSYRDTQNHELNIVGKPWRKNTKHSKLFQYYAEQ